MPSLTLPSGFAFPNLITELSAQDSMFDGRSDHYLSVGISALNVIEAAFGDREPVSILDLPCGFGRVTRMLRARYPKARIAASDLDRAAVDFTAAAFDARGVYSTPDFRDLEMGERFDLIWVGSLLTHLPEHLTRKFLDFAVRHMGPESLLIVTSHGEYVANRLSASTYGLAEDAARGLHGQYLSSGYGYRGYDGSASYGISVTAKAWFETLLAGSALRLQSCYERGWDRHQDVLVLRRAAADRPEFWRRVVGRGQSRRTAIRSFDDRATGLPLSGAAQAEQDAATVPGFDERWYCEHNADVGDARRSGILPSGFAHYVAFGWKEGRAPFDPARSYPRRMPSLAAAWTNGIIGGIDRIEETWSVNPTDRTEDVGAY